jgi:hypothetical protein
MSTGIRMIATTMMIASADTNTMSAETAANIKAEGEEVSSAICSTSIDRTDND